MRKHAPGKGTPCIILPTDFQKPARRAFAYGVTLSRALDANLDILHVIKTVSDSTSLPPDSRYLRGLKTKALLDLGRLTRAARDAGVHAEARLQYGVPEDGILKLAKQTRAEMIVMGTEGRTGWDRLRLGSTAQAIVRAASCPVLAVHGGVAGDAALHAAPARLHRLFVATDFSPSSDAALHLVSRLAAGLRAEVRVLHAMETGTTTVTRRRIAQLVTVLRQQGLKADGLCLPGHPVETILRQAAAWKADVIAVGSQGRRRLNRLVLGPVAEQLLRRAGCPVLTTGGKPPRAT